MQKYQLKKIVCSSLFVLSLLSMPTLANNATETSSKAESRNLDLLQQTRFQQPPDWTFNTFKNADGATIRYGKTTVENAKGTIVLVTGFTEFAEVYYETIRDLLAHKYNVYEMDWRGEGGSDRYLPDREKAYSLGFDHDEKDLNQFVTTIVQPETKSPIILMAHSIGSHIALRTLHDYPTLFDRAVLSAPAVTLTVRESPWIVSLFTWFQCLLGKSSEYTTAQGNWAYMEPKISKMITHSHDEERVRLEAAWANKNTELRSGGATWKWLQEFISSLDIMEKHQYLREIKTKILIGCPTEDLIIRPESQKELGRYIPNVEVYKVEGGRHDLFLESQEYRAPWLEKIYEFIDKI